MVYLFNVLEFLRNIRTVFIKVVKSEETKVIFNNDHQIISPSTKTK